MNLILIAIGGAFGAVARYLMQSFIGRYSGVNFPYGTLIVNITGSILMGMFIGWLARATQGSQEQIRLFIAVGILGGYTTFSSFSLDAVNLLQEGRTGPMCAYVLTSVVLSLAGLFAGLRFMRLFA